MMSGEVRFCRQVKGYYKQYGRHNLPWRKTTDPYRILVSEIMLQQTQVDRVILKYTNFIERFPTIRELASAPLAEVLREWQGLGYNGRAKKLHECAHIVISEFGGRLPQTLEDLIKLPGVGPYTSAALMVFAYNKPVAMIETNIRTVYIHHFFDKKENIADSDILFLIEGTMDRGNPREWYWALMDYGTFIKKEFGNPNRRSRHYIRQSRFSDSNRQIRGAIIRLLAETRVTRNTLHQRLTFDPERVDEQLESLMNEGMIIKHKYSYQLP